MRVCHIWHNFHPFEFGGVERYILSLSNFLSRKDINNKFILITDKAAYVSLVRSFRTPSSEKVGNLEVHRLGPNFSSLLRGAVGRTLRTSTAKLDQNLASSLFKEALAIPDIETVDVYHIHGLWKPLYPTLGLQLSKHFNRPFIVTLHGDSVNPNDPYSMPLKSPPLVSILRQASKITTFANESFKMLSEIGLEQKSRLIPNFVDTRLFACPNRNHDTLGNRLLMVTRLSKAKDPLTPIRAFAQITKEVPTATFKIVGYGPLYEEAKDLIEQLGLQGRVFLLGMRSNVKEYMCDSDIFIGARGGYMSTLEAWSAGLAVVAPGFGIMNELVSNGENGLLVEPGNPREFACSVINLIKNRSYRETIIKNGLAAAQSKDISNVSQQIENIYKQALVDFH